MGRGKKKHNSSARREKARRKTIGDFDLPGEEDACSEELESQAQLDDACWVYINDVTPEMMNAPELRQEIESPDSVSFKFKTSQNSSTSGLVMIKYTSPQVKTEHLNALLVKTKLDVHNKEHCYVPNAQQVLNCDRYTMLLSTAQGLPNSITQEKLESVFPEAKLIVLPKHTNSRYALLFFENVDQCKLMAWSYQLSIDGLPIDVSYFYHRKEFVAMRTEKDDYQVMAYGAKMHELPELKGMLLSKGVRFTELRYDHKRKMTSLEMASLADMQTAIALSGWVPPSSRKTKGITLAAAQNRKQNKDWWNAKTQYQVSQKNIKEIRSQGKKEEEQAALDPTSQANNPYALLLGDPGAQASEDLDLKEPEETHPAKRSKLEPGTNQSGGYPGRGRGRGKGPCKFFMQSGTCRYGDNCSFSHDQSAGSSGFMSNPRRGRGAGDQGFRGRGGGQHFGRGGRGFQGGGQDYGWGGPGGYGGYGQGYGDGYFGGYY